MAQYDFDEARLRRLLAQRLAMSDEQRGSSLKTGRENNSARGLLQSTIALDDQTDRNKEYDRQNALTNQDYNDQFGTIARGRVSTTSDYNEAEAEKARLAALQTPLTQPFDPEDPLNWKGIAAEQKALGNPQFQDPAPNPGPPNDPLNWAAIAQQLGDAGDPAFARYKKPKPVVSTLKGALSSG
jgi:hypothetical protein